MASEQCCANPPALSANSGSGCVVEDFGGIKAYTAGAADSKAAVILVSDVYGFEAPKLRKIADLVATFGYFVVVPDFMHGDPFQPENAERPIQIWLQSHSTAKGVEEAKLVIAALKEKGASAVGAAGFCWGAKVVVELAKEGLIQAGTLLHPSFITPGDFNDVKCPITILGAEHDHLSPPEMLKQCEEVLSSKLPLDYHVKIFPGVAHGWSVRYNDDDPHAIGAAEEAHLDTVNWFNKHLK